MPGNLPQRRSCRRGNWPVVAIADRGWPCLAHVILPVRLGLGEITHCFLALWHPSRLPRLENRRLGFEPLCQRKQSSFDTGALAHCPTATLSCFDSQQFWRVHSIHLTVAMPGQRLMHAPILSTPLQCNCGGICSLEEFAVGAPLIFWRACPQRSLRTAKSSASFSLGAWRSTPQLPSQRIRAWRSGRAIPSCPGGARSVSRGRTTT
jgi:hypothetical protein